MLRLLAFRAGLVVVLTASLALHGAAVAADASSSTSEPLAGLRQAASITVDDEGVPHVRARSEHDLYFMQGWVHARERLFQMDYNRRLGSGTLAELVGIAALSSAHTEA